MQESQIIAFFRQQQLKVTPQRLMITKYLLSRKDHPSAEDVFQALHEKFPTLSIATVYKTLNLLREMGLVQELGFGDGAVRYDPNLQLHINLICTRCHSITDYHPAPLESCWQKLLTTLETAPVGQRIDLYYVCDACKK